MHMQGALQRDWLHEDLWSLKSFTGYNPGNVKFNFSVLSVKTPWAPFLQGSHAISMVDVKLKKKSQLKSSLYFSPLELGKFRGQKLDTKETGISGLCYVLSVESPWIMTNLFDESRTFKM